MTCVDQAILDDLKDIGLFTNSNGSDSKAPCIDPSNSTASFSNTEGFEHHMGAHADTSEAGKRFYAYVTPIILVVGLIGNSISLKVFLSRNLNRLSASLYLAALSASDTLVLLTYVLLEWLAKGLPYWPGNHRAPIINIEGICHLFLFSSYTFRFVSVWLIVVFTIERYIAVCRPLQRRIICTKTFARRIIVGVTLAGALLSLYKPILGGLFSSVKEPSAVTNGNNRNHVLAVNGVYVADDDFTMSDFAPGDPIGGVFCTRNPEYAHFVLVMDVVYGLLITAVPFLVITVFNMIIMRKLVNRDTFRSQVKIKFRENRVRLEFTITLLVVSSCFICLNFPYFVVYCQQFVQSIDPTDYDASMVVRTRDHLFITKTIFNINYSINFFLYCVTGTYYRGAIKAMLTCSNKDPFSPIPMRKASTSTNSAVHTQMKELSYV